jgi:3'-phosphoadenosine 5'-phosphosulfate sulfotransferase (PAPS reductase)/FAD synthetase
VSSMSKYWMYRLVIRDEGLRDRISSIISKYYGKWLHITDNISTYSYNIVVEEDKRANIKLENPLTVVVKLPGTIDAKGILKYIELGRAYFRNYIVWRNNTYVYSSKGSPLEKYDVKPAYDVFIAIGKDYNRLFLEHGLNPPLNPLINKRFGGEYYIYDGPYLHGILVVPDKGYKLTSIRYRGERIHDEIDLDKLVNENIHVLNQHIIVSRKFLQSLGDPDIVIVSFSGGKDSLVVLHLAINHYGRDKVVGIYVDTGVDFPQTRDFVKNISEYLGITVKRVRADVDKLIPRKGFPTINNRWCTLRKTAAFKRALREYVRKYSKILVLVGDRDSESLARSRKPPVRRRRYYLEAAPIKQWSTLLVQLYHLKYKLPINPLYLLGFYRLGCYICPALTSLERYIMFKKLVDTLRKEPYFPEYYKLIMRKESQ